MLKIVFNEFFTHTQDFDHILSSPKLYTKNYEIQYCQS